MRLGKSSFERGSARIFAEMGCAYEGEGKAGGLVLTDYRPYAPY